MFASFLSVVCLLNQLVLCATGCDVVLDPVGGAPFAEAMKVVKWGGQIAIIGFASGTIPKVNSTPCCTCLNPNPYKLDALFCMPKHNQTTTSKTSSL